MQSYSICVDVMSLLTCYSHQICHSQPNVLFQMENLILSCFSHSLPALDNHKPLWALSCLPTFATSFNHSITKKTRHIAGNGHTDGQRKSLLLETSHLLWSLLIWEKSRSRPIFIFVMQARQQKNFECRDGETYGKAGYSGSLVGWWGISDGMSFQSHQELQHKQCATWHHLEKGLQSSKERKTT